MGFLYQVLKDVSEKQPYSVGKNTLDNNILTLFNKDLCSGHEGFKTLFTKLPDRIAAYNSEVQQGNEKVRKPIKTLYDYVDKKSGKLRNALNDIQVTEHSNDKEVEDAKTKVYLKLGDCLHKAEVFETNIGDARSQTNDLNFVLRTNVINKVNSVTHERRQLVTLSKKEHEDLMSIEKTISAALRELEQDVDAAIDDRVTKLVAQLKAAVQNILHKLVNIRTTLTGYANQLAKWIDATDKLVKDALRLVSAILNEVNENYTSNKTAQAISAIQQIERDATALYNDVEVAREKVKEAVNSAKSTEVAKLGTWKTAASGVVDKAKGKCTDIGERVKSASGEKTKIYDNTLALKDKANRLLQAYRQTSEKVESLKQQVEDAVRHLEDKIQDDLHTIKNEIKEGLKNVIGAFQKGVTDAGNPATAATAQSLIEGFNSKMDVGAAPGLKAWSKHAMSGGNLQGALEALAAAFEGKGYTPFKAFLKEFPRITQSVGGEQKTIFQSIINDLDGKVDSVLRADDLPQKVRIAVLTTYDREKRKSTAEGGMYNEALGAVQNVLQIFTTDTSRGSAGHMPIKTPVSAQQDIQDVTQRFQTISEELKEIAGLIDSTKKTGGGMNDGIQQYLDDLKNRGLESGEWTPLGGTASTGLMTIKGEIDAALKKIEDEVTAALRGTTKTYAEIAAQTYTATGQVIALCNAIKKAAGNDEGLQKLLIELESKNLNCNESTQLAKIRNDLNRLVTDDLTAVIEAVDSFVTTEANLLRIRYVEELKTFVKDRVASAISDLTTAARRNYVTSVKQLLTAFADKVEKELRELPGEIDKDLTIGFKGLMKRFEGELIQGENIGNNIKLLKGAENVRDLSYSFKVFNGPLQMYLEREIKRVHDENMSKKHPKGQDEEIYTAKITAIFAALNELLMHITGKNKYDHRIPSKLDNLEAAIKGLKPEEFAMPNTPVLDGIVNGLGKFIEEFRKVYISRYDSQTFESEVIHDTGKDVGYSTRVYRITELTEYGRKCAKVFMTVTPILYDALTDLKDSIDGSHSKWNSYTIYNKSQSNHSLHRLFFNENGYDVGRAGNTEHGELNHKSECNGTRILRHLRDINHKLFSTTSSSITGIPSSSDDDSGPTLEVVDECGVIHQLHDNLVQYFKVRHLTHIDKPRAPCNIYEMLLWACGLQFNSVYDKLLGYCDSLFAKQKDKQEPDREIPVPVVAYPNSITPERIISAVKHITSHAYLVLTGILGTGDALTVYACDFPTNSLGLQYPTSGADCYHYLLDILRRVLPVFSFLQSQCGYPAADMGWSQCLYGKAIDPSSWQCTDHPKNKPKCEPKCESNCRPTSPLMSYLTDCLAGYLPHKLESIGCKSECKSCPSNQPGLPCLTPLGFKAFSGCTHRGKDLYDIISEFLDHLHIPALFCLAPRPPSNIAEHFAFSLCLVKGWHHSSQLTKKGVEELTFENKFKMSIRDLSINLQDKPEELTDALTDAYGSESADHKACKQNHVSSLTSWDACSKMKDHCSPYLASLSSDSYVYIANKHTSAYLSWATYLPWQFWNYLNSLLDAFSNIACNEFGCRSCMHGDTCSPGKHGMLDTSCNCLSMVSCKGVSPTLYRYGLRFATGWELHDEQTRKACFAFRTQLNKVLHSDYFKNLFQQCDKFLFKIRAPFIWLNVALWLLSLFYLLHIMVIRLDLLHIKSHLHSPSSHRIAAQSLLAAGRVNKLNRVFYLQP